MKQIFLILFLGGIFFTASGQERTASPLKMTLQQCIDFALNNSYSRQSVKLNEEAAQDRYNQSTKERLPDLSATVDENLNHSKGNTAAWNGNYGLNSSLVLYQGGNISENIKKSKLSAEQTEYLTKQYDNDLVIQILQTFLSALGNEELLKYQQSLLQLSEEQVKLGSERFRLGEILESDYLLLQSQYATDKNNIAETTIQRENSLLALKSLLSIEPLQTLEIVYPDAESIEWMAVLPNESTVLENTQANLPNFRISRYNVEIAGTAVKMAKSGHSPTVSLIGSTGSGHLNGASGFGIQLSDRFAMQAGITVNIPIFDRNRTKSNVTQSRIALKQAKLEEKQTTLSLQQTVLQEYRNVVSSLSSFETSQIKEKAYSASFATYRKQYDAGSITTVELLQQQNNYINALNEYIQDKYSFMLKRKILDVYMGVN
ncbi:MAG: Outer membrane protein TolC [Candidatus Ordinivivax streblomastigis]|uniref:Outer membrane protein TolC n=1 Tax=Candidatus Ordinivivax streblomastigis TaxID=2540710 RepID=A0A5M8P2K1_9BACT|nr:MAG: Outer membrane protein TolC [Candidatus Ordinivivax streblomastigis]